MPGLEWKKLDLHVHTPGSKCFAGSTGSAANDRDSVTPEMIVQAAVDKELDGIAVTDHMSGDWIDRVAAAAKSRGLVVFPAVELSVEGGYHVVGILDVDKGSKDITLLLGDLDVKGVNYGSTAVPISRGSKEVLSAIKAHGGLAVLAHIDCPYTGAWHKTSGATRLELFNSNDYAAVEITQRSLPAELTSEHQKKGGGIHRSPAYYYASDNPCPDDTSKHCLAGVGTRFSYFKVIDAFTLESLRQCFDDPQVRIRLPDQLSEKPIPRVLSMTVKGRFFPSQEFYFHRGLNSIIGGKGVGKSLVVEFLRLGLDCKSSVKSIAEDHNSKVVEQLGPGGSVTVECITKNGDKLSAFTSITNTSQRVGGRQPTYASTAIVTNVVTGEKLNVDMRSLFPLKAYSQGEIVEIGREKYEQMMQLDSFIDLSPVDRQIAERLEELDSHIGTLLDSMAATQRLDELTRAAATTEVEVKGLEGQLRNEVFAKHQMHEAANRALETAVAQWEGLLGPLTECYTQLASWKQTDATDNGLAAELLAKIRQDQTEAKERAVAQLESALQALQTARNLRKAEIEAWEASLKGVRASFEEFKAKAGGDYEVLAKRLQVLTSKWDKDKDALVLAEAKAKTWSEVSEAALLTCDKIDELVTERHSIRTAKASQLTELSDRLLKIDVEKCASQAGALAVLKEAQSAQREQVLASYAAALAPYRLALLLLGVSPEKATPTWTTDEQWLKVKTKVLSRDDVRNYLSRLARALPEDLPRIQFLKHGNTYAGIEELSQGQKCTALIVLTMLEGEGPVLIDQPEDSLDVRAVWEDIVTGIRAKKNDRQFIFTTHNSSIAVAGDSDCITILEPKGKVAVVESIGAIEEQNVKDGVITHLEGGRKPYNLRRRKYHIPEE
jgi:hypothetical protein